jgi:hypothetical protein
MVLFEAKTTRFNIFLQHKVHDWPFTFDRGFNWNANADYPSRIVQLVPIVHIGAYTVMITTLQLWKLEIPTVRGANLHLLDSGTCPP